MLARLEGTSGPVWSPIRISPGCTTPPVSPCSWGSGYLIYVAEAGSDILAEFAARTSLRRSLVESAGGKALLAVMSQPDRVAYLKWRPAAETSLVEQFLADFDDIRRSRLARNTHPRSARSRSPPPSAIGRGRWSRK
jgi:DNA-binding IclR family transcriptional regulator